jgi:hypothetical protein
MPTVFIDTNIAIAGSYMRSATSRALLKACMFLGFDMVIPETVVDEIKGKFLECLKEQFALT